MVTSVGLREGCQAHPHHAGQFRRGQLRHVRDAAYGPRFLGCGPNARISVMGGELGRRPCWAQVKKDNMRSPGRW